MRTPESDIREVDCAIVGGGAAGLSAAINLGRMRRSVLLVDERDRFRWRHVAYNYLGFPNGIPADQIRRLGWRHAAKYGVRLLLGHVATATREGERFRLRIDRLPENGAPGARPGPSIPRDAEMAAIFGEVPEGGPLEVRARTVILASGVIGHFPEFPGRDECVGQSLFWCIHCEGYESIDRLVGVVGHDEDAVQTALDLLEFTARVTIVAGRPEGFAVPSSRLADLAANGIAAHPFGVAEYENRAGQMRALVLDDPEQTRIPVEQVYTIRSSRAPNELAVQLGVELNSIGQVIVTSEQRTNVPGVFAAGDATSLHDHQLSAAAHEGNQAACGANYVLYRPVQRAFGGAEEC
ncbi:MAG: NAD(P)/FAD-dependent oxidoreductase [Candidatus Limnocylindrales bacterium]|jgi:thioredoxin reductase (NADPH)